MKGKLVTKIFLDIVMSILFVVLIDAFGTGLVFHEIAGLFILGLFTAHTILNWAWVKSVTLNILNHKKISSSITFKYFLNAMLLIGVIIIGVTGIIISEVLFPSAAAKSEWFYLTHKWTAYSCLGLFSLHFALHGRYFVQSLAKIAQNFREKNTRKTLVRLGAICVLIFVLYTRVLSTVSAKEEITYSSEIATSTTQISEAISSSANADATSTTDDTASADNIVSTDNTDTVIASDTRASSSSSIDATLSTSTQTDTTITLTQYLSDLYCSVCHKHCPLSAPQCGKADPEIQTATAEYQAQYGSVE